MACLLAPPPPALKTCKLGRLFRLLHTALKVSNMQQPILYPKQHKTMFETSRVLGEVGWRVVVLWVAPRTSHTLGKHSTHGYRPRP